MQVRQVRLWAKAFINENCDGVLNAPASDFTFALL